MPTLNAKTTRTTASAPRREWENSAPSPEAIRREIQERAKKIFIQRNGGAGDALSDWLQAEREVKARYQNR
jgi:hypothetical protein